ncbi:phosphotransferase enzyme family protein [Actinacidiphila glaucinigra]|uniref:Phosphotransferase enzyme family protein n=1 Tax=Actinacidiphila glaucinigra TaxID=235986 RepID=A0A239MWW3_9ACTN|nr:phosphotransferase [Actinacidiphila glaucinigra]SNT46733.1 Phosphotransferase enzyme family protein [Actinacidiphila glaucinigra]
MNSAPGDPGSAVRRFAEHAVGRITRWTDTSWPREASRVWRVDGADGRTGYVKVHLNDRFHAREVTAYRTWVPALGGAAPRLIAADARLRAVVVTAVPGRPLSDGVRRAPNEERTLFVRIGALAAAIHGSAPPRPRSADEGPAAWKLDRHLDGARAHLAPGDEEFVRTLTARSASLPPLDLVPTHGDFQLRNLLWSGRLAVIDFERSEPQPALRDLVRLSDAWTGRPDLHEAFLTGYGRPLTPSEEERLAVDSALDAVSGIRYGAAEGDPEVLARGLRTLARLRSSSSPGRREREGR